MASVNISIREEAYRFLKSLKAEDKSFSDVILEFKGERSNKNNVMWLFGALKESDVDWKTKEKKMKEFRVSFNRRVINK